MVKPAAGHRPLAYSSPEAVQTTGTVAFHLCVGLRRRDSDRGAHERGHGLCSENAIIAARAIGAARAARSPRTSRTQEGRGSAAPERDVSGSGGAIEPHGEFRL